MYSCIGTSSHNSKEDLTIFTSIVPLAYINMSFILQSPKSASIPSINCSFMGCPTPLPITITHGSSSYAKMSPDSSATEIGKKQIFMSFS
jgi:hypothetical protein